MNQRRRLFTAGLKGSTVNGFAVTLPSGAKVVRIEWREFRRRHTKSWPMTAEGRRLARATAEGVAERLQGRVEGRAERLTITDLFNRYLLAKEHEWRPATRRGTIQRWNIFANYVGVHEFADNVSPDTLDEVRAKLRRTPRGRGKVQRPMVANQIRETLSRVCTVWRWAKQRKLIAENPLSDYVNTIGKDEGALEIPEYTPEQYAKIIRELSPDRATSWRAYCVIALAGVTGKRERALLELQWSAVDLAAGVITWPKTSDKVGKVWTQPMGQDARDILAIAERWRTAIGYTGPYVFPPARAASATPHYHASSVIHALHEAEDRAGVPRVPYKALHSIKRYVVRSLYDTLGGDLLRVGRFVGNTSEKVLRKSYLRDRVGDLDVAAQAMKLPQRQTEAPHAVATKRQSTRGRAKPSTRKSR